MLKLTEKTDEKEEAAKEEDEAKFTDLIAEEEAPEDITLKEFDDRYEGASEYSFSGWVRWTGEERTGEKH